MTKQGTSPNFFGKESSTISSNSNKQSSNKQSLFYKNVSKTLLYYIEYLNRIFPKELKLATNGTYFFHFLLKKLKFQFLTIISGLFLIILPNKKAI